MVYKVLLTKSQVIVAKYKVDSKLQEYCFGINSFCSQNEHVSLITGKKQTLTDTKCPAGIPCIFAIWKI